MSTDPNLDPEQNPSTPQSEAGTNATDRFRDEIAKKKQSELDDDEDEISLWSGGYSPKAMIGTWILMFVISIVLLALPMLSEFSFKNVLLIIAGIWIIGGLMYAYRRLGYHYELTTQRFIHQTGILQRQTDRIEVIDIDDVSFSQGPIQRIFGVGAIELTGSDRTHPTLSMIGIPEVKTVSDLIDDIRRKERRRRSLHIESI